MKQKIDRYFLEFFFGELSLVGAFYLAGAIIGNIAALVGWVITGVFVGTVVDICVMLNLVVCLYFVFLGRFEYTVQYRKFDSTDE